MVPHECQYVHVFTLNNPTLHSNPTPALALMPSPERTEGMEGILSKKTNDCLTKHQHTIPRTCLKGQCDQRCGLVLDHEYVYVEGNERVKRSVVLTRLNVAPLEFGRSDAKSDVYLAR